MKAKLATPLLIACALFLAIGNGTGLYEHMFAIPAMLSSPDALHNVINSNQGQPTRFWIPLHALILITLILSLIFNWKDPNRKRLVLMVSISYLYISIVSIFFAKQLFAFEDIADVQEFARQTSRWIALSWHRPMMGLASVVLLMVAISRSSTRVVSQ
ncbi:hypothetical protein [Chryseolinea lacunae]|uniref:DUF1772 domain-containing protein n=1 Tax=Chryseolinea lacunae TaxID=2801331 RepID=A0ABS1KQ61_9BACT|nr:hypothetical protein [Chryseolinea lacunae]MBL0741443.1 hypothetical protein [Chryseolinea lacunae]